MDKGRNCSGVSAEEVDALLEMHHQAYEQFAGDQVETALETLKRMEERLEIYTTQGNVVDQDLVLCTLNNIACCYQRMERVEQAAAYLEACIAPCLCRLGGTLRDLAREMNTGKYQCMVHMQLCALLSQLGSHQAALRKAKQGIRLASFSLEATIQAYRLQSTKFLQYKKRKAPVPDSVAQNNVLAQRAYPTLRCLERFFETGEIEMEEDPQMRSVLGVKTFGDWVYLLSISDMMVIQPLLIEDVKQKLQIRTEFTKDLMLNKVATLAVAYFCVSTELKFLRGKQAYNPERDRDGEVMHGKAIALLKTFFPHECPLLTHISQAYEKRYKTELQEIPEASESGSQSRRLSAHRQRKSTKSQDFSIQSSKRTSSPSKPSTARVYTRSQSHLKQRSGRERSNPVPKKLHSRGEIALSDGFSKKHSSSRSRLSEGRSSQRTRERKNKSAELIRSGEPEPSFASFEQEDAMPPSQFFIS